MRRIHWKESLRVGSALALAGACALILSSCVFANNVSPVEFGVVDGHVTLAFCKSGVIESMFVEQRPSVSGDQWETVWQGDGEYGVAKGDLLTLDGPVEGLTGGGEGSVDVSEGTKYGLLVIYASTRAGGEPVTYESSFSAPRGGLLEGMWLDYQGGASSAPCD